MPFRFDRHVLRAAGEVRRLVHDHDAPCADRRAERESVEPAAVFHQGFQPAPVVARTGVGPAALSVTGGPVLPAHIRDRGEVERHAEQCAPQFPKLQFSGRLLNSQHDPGKAAVGGEESIQQERPPVIAPGLQIGRAVKPFPRRIDPGEIDLAAVQPFVQPGETFRPALAGELLQRARHLRFLQIVTCKPAGDRFRSFDGDDAVADGHPLLRLLPAPFHRDRFSSGSTGKQQRGRQQTTLESLHVPSFPLHRNQLPVAN